jgi:uncharacterized protein (DUF952 family)
MAHIYLLMTTEEIAAARERGTWTSANFASEGFIHASPYEQLERVANKHYRHKSDVQIVCVEGDRLTSELRWEPAAGSLYPHIYGPLNFEAVVDIVPTERNEDGTIRIPRV